MEMWKETRKTWYHVTDTQVFSNFFEKGIWVLNTQICN